MSDETDLDLYQAPGSGLEPDPQIPPSPEPPSPWPVILGAILIIGVAAAFFFFRSHRPEPSAAPAAVAAPGVSAPPAARKQDEEPLPVLPPLGESDRAVREIVSGLSQHPLVAAWLGGDQLLRGLAQVGVSVAEGHSPASLLRRLAPGTAFSVRSEGGRTMIDPASYRRYDQVASAVDSLDPAAAGHAYRVLRPRLDEAYKELGMEGTIDTLVARAANQVLAAPAVDGPVAVVPSGIVYAYADPALEDLPPVAKLLVRMGPENVRRIQAKVRAILPEMRLQAGTR